MVDWLEELLARVEDDEREEDGVLPDWSLRLTAHALPPEQGTGGEEEKYGRTGPEDGADVRSAETDARETADGVVGRSWTKDGLERQENPGNNVENRNSRVLNSAFLLSGTAERRTEGSAFGPGGQADGTAENASGPGGQADRTGEVEPGTALDRLAQALSGMGQRDGTERHAGAAWPDEMAAIPADWAEAELKGTRAFGEQDKTARIKADSGVEWLYRQTAGAEWPAAPGPVVQTVGQAETETGPAALTLEELDRAVRRDSRRYDGEMCIY